MRQPSFRRLGAQTFFDGACGLQCTFSGGMFKHPGRSTTTFIFDRSDGFSSSVLLAAQVARRARYRYNAEDKPHLTDELKRRHSDTLEESVIPWKKVAGIGNVLRHDYGNIAAPIIWKLVQDDLPELGEACRLELELASRETS